MNPYEEYKKEQAEKLKQQREQELLNLVKDIKEDKIDLSGILSVLKEISQKEYSPEIKVDVQSPKIPEIKIPKIELPQFPKINIPTPEVNVINDNKELLDKLSFDDIKTILEAIKKNNLTGDKAIVKSIKELEEAISELQPTITSVSAGGVDNKILQDIADNTASNPIEYYIFNELYKDSGNKYICKETKDGDWLIQKFDINKVMSYATILNNPSITDYQSARDDILNLNYEQAHKAF